MSYFTSGGMESSNFALRGLAYASRKKGTISMFPLSNIIPLPTQQEFLRGKDLSLPFFPLINTGKIEVKRRYKVTYSQEVIEHFMNPKNAGEIPDADGVGIEGNPPCRDMMYLYIKVKDDKIEDRGH